MLQHEFSSDQKSYLVIPSVPTPNGRLHLGHIGGPYLSADIFARHMQRFGHDVQIIVGTDSYESYVTAKAEQEDKTPEEICHHYHALIQQDLAAFSIQTTLMINPLTKEWKDRYQHWQLTIFQQLQQNNAIVTHHETVWWNSDKQRYETGCWLKGQCALCHATVTGYFCENCGAHFRPEEIQLTQNIADTHLVKENVSNLYMRLPTTEKFTASGINAAVINAYQKFLQQQQGLFRLTANSAWGVAIPAICSLPRSTLFNYGLMFSYFLLMGEVLGEANGSGKNAFAYDSNITTLSTFGFDNAVPFLASILGITEYCKAYKPFDNYLVNYFYHLDGQKFSTSRNHAIWAADIATDDEFTIDITRLYLSSINVRQQIGHFDTQQYSAFSNKMREWIKQHIGLPLSFLAPGHQHTNTTLMNMLVVELKYQQEVLQPQRFAPHLAVTKLYAWQQQMENADHQHASYGWWLKSFALLALPFMPQLSEHIWQRLANTAKPIVNNF
jgi:methionyl-tRNA synthetase